MNGKLPILFSHPKYQHVNNLGIVFISSSYLKERVSWPLELYLIFLNQTSQNTTLTNPFSNSPRFAQDRWLEIPFHGDESQQLRSKHQP